MTKHKVHGCAQFGECRWRYKSSAKVNDAEEAVPFVANAARNARFGEINGVQEPVSGQRPRPTFGRVW